MSENYKVNWKQNLDGYMQIHIPEPIPQAEESIEKLDQLLLLLEIANFE